MWRNTPAPGDLRDLHPDLALNLDTEFLIAELRTLGLQHVKRYRKKTVVIDVAMLPHHLLRISPVDVNGGFGEWTTWYWTHGDEENPPQLRYSIRAHIEITDLHNSPSQSCVSFTSHNDDMESLIRNAISGMRHVTGVKIDPVVRRKIR